MKCYIVSKDKKIYLKRNEFGRPIPCTKNSAELFDIEKANNILKSIPRTLKNNGFYLVEIEDDKLVKEKKNISIIKHESFMENIKEASNNEETKSYNNEEQEFSKTVIKLKSCNEKKIKNSTRVTSFKSKVKQMESLIEEMKVRKEELTAELSNVDKELQNVLHTIELEDWKNACDGYRYYKESKVVLEKRREIKDELQLVSQFLSTSVSNISSDRFDKTLDNIINDRVYIYRSVV